MTEATLKIWLFRACLRCEILAHGLARARCDACGHDDSSPSAAKAGGVCPSCNTRRMAEPSLGAPTGTQSTRDVP
jgi:RNA polymerase subunit RPABC4/transcription elongation factor Spt4